MKESMLNVLKIALSAVCVFSMIFLSSKDAFSFPPPGCKIFLHQLRTAGKKRPEIKEIPQAKLQSGKDVGTIAWSEITGGPKHIRGPITAPSQDDPETIVLRFLEEKKVLYGIDDPYQDLYKIKSGVSQWTGYTTMHFGQIYKGVPVENRLVVSVAPNGVISTIHGIYYPDIEVDVNPTVSAEEAKATTLSHAVDCGTPFDDLPEGKEPVFLLLVPTVDEEYMKNIEPELLIWPTGDKDYLLWHFRTPYWSYYVDAQDGVIRGANSTFSTFGSSGTSSGTSGETDTTWSNMEVTPISLDFGKIRIGQNSPIKEIVIANTGEADLIITDISLGEAAFALKGFSNSLPVSITPDENLTLELCFSPTSSGVFEGSMVIAGNDPYYPQFEIALQGKGSFPTLNIQEVTQSPFYYSLAYYPFWPKSLDLYKLWPYYSFSDSRENNIKYFEYFDKNPYFLFPYAPFIDLFNQAIWGQQDRNYFYNSSNLPYLE